MSRRNEHGQTLVLFAILLPLVLLIAVLSVDVGNWWVHKRRLQTQVDAAALAGAPVFLDCFREEESVANSRIASEALKYAGDWRRDNSTLNLQVQEPTDVFVALNSARYWDRTDGTDENAPSPGYGLDYTASGDDPSTPEIETSSLPCDGRFLDVKATDDQVSPLWGLIPGLRDDIVVPSPKTHAKVEVHKIQGLSGMLPWAIPEVDPKAVGVLFVDEEAPATAPIVASRALFQPDPQPAGLGEFSVWDSPTSQVINIGDGEVQDDRARIGVVVVVSEKPNPTLDGSLQSICTQDLVNVKCYGYGTNPSPTSGLYYIHGHAGRAMLKQVRLENLNCGADNKSAPYFAQSGDCDIRFRAVIDFGVKEDPTGPPVRASVNNMSWAPCADDEDLGCWTSTRSFALPEAGSPQAGRQDFSISWSTNPPGGGPKPSGTFEGVAHPYVADKHSGPVEYIQVTAGPNPADSVGFGPNSFFVRVGLNRPLDQTPKLDPPILLRFKSGSLSQTVNCDTDNVVYEPPFKPGWDLNSMFKDAAEIAYGCVTQYNINGPGPCPTEYDTVAELPPDTTKPDPIPTCAEGRPGEAAKMREGLEYRFESPCTQNNWPKKADDPYPAIDDQRYVILIVTDFGAFDENNQRVVKVRRFAGFYATGWDEGPAGGGGRQTGSCDDNDPHPLGLDSNRDNADVWGYFVSFVALTGGEPADELCNFGELDVCVVGLVE